MADRAQDTEAIRAAWEGDIDAINHALNEGESAITADVMLAADLAIDRLVARLEAAERERDEAMRELAIVERVSQRNANAHMDAERRARAALAAAAPGETTAVPGRYQGGTDDEGCKGSWPGCMDDGCNWPNGPCAAPGETEQTP